MRVIAGEFRRRILKTLPGLDTRPTPDRLRETLFNIIGPQLPGRTFVDGYAGTGAVGIEALSRGAALTIFIERSRAAVEVIRDNLNTLGIKGRTEIHTGKTLTTLGKVAADIVFLDPPYELEREYVECLDVLASKTVELVIIQHASRFATSAERGVLKRYRIVKQGDSSLSFYRSGAGIDADSASGTNHRSPERSSFQALP